MKAEAMRAKSADELKEMVMDLRKEQMTLRFQKHGQQLTNTSQLRNVRRDIARAKTLLAEQNKGAAKPAKAAKSAKKEVSVSETDQKSKTAKAAPAKKAAKAKA
jgi:large subunit ribosomal protein L29